MRGSLITDALRPHQRELLKIRQVSEDPQPVIVDPCSPASHIELDERQARQVSQPRVREPFGPAKVYMRHVIQAAESLQCAVADLGVAVEPRESQLFHEIECRLPVSLRDW